MYTVLMHKVHVQEYILRVTDWHTV